MSLKDDMQTDSDIFYDVKEFAYEATFNNGEENLVFPVLFRDDIEIESIVNKVISVLNKNKPGLVKGSTLLIDGINYKCISFDEDDSIETFIGLVKV